jgi:hypothetical protein
MKKNTVSFRSGFLLSVLFLPGFLFGQTLQGEVQDEQGAPLPFAAVYIEGTSAGTTTNAEGVFSLSIPDSDAVIVFQYVGYQSERRSLSSGQLPAGMVVRLQPVAQELAAVEVSAAAEDPAYAIIRNAIRSRESHLREVETYACDVYIKGQVRLLDVPQKFMGAEIGDLSGSLDSSRQGIVYLSESVSRLFFRWPDRFKEEMFSSKVSGNNQGFSFNSATEMNVNLYRNTSAFGRAVLSPIADNALDHYRYRLEGTFFDRESGSLYHRIALLPRRPEEAVYAGHVYLVDSTWHIHSVDLRLTGRSAQFEFMDTLTVRQLHVPLRMADGRRTWQLFSQTYAFEGKALILRFGGSFTGVYSGYNLSPELPANFFGNEVMKVLPSANEKDSAYWDAVRPVPLTGEESADYRRKDSLQVIFRSRSYLDSTDRADNRFELSDLLTGYTYRNSYRRRTYSVYSPLTGVQYNLVQGANMRVGVGFEQGLDSVRDVSLALRTNLQYGWADRRWRWSAGLVYRFLPKQFGQLRLSGGSKVVQVNEDAPISPSLQTAEALFSRRNFARYFDKRYVRLAWQQEPWNGFRCTSSLTWARRSALENRTDYSFFFRADRAFDTNVPNHPDVTAAPPVRFPQSVLFDLSLRWRPGQRYVEYPHTRILMGSRFPEIRLNYQKGIPFRSDHTAGLSGQTDFDRLSLAVRQPEWSLGLAGTMAFHVEAGFFPNQRRMSFLEYRHFMGNRTGLGNRSAYLTHFKTLPYYRYSTDRAWMEVHWQHNFKGAVLDRLPLLNTLGWNLVVGANALKCAGQPFFAELSCGVDNLGWGVMRLFRLDVVPYFMENGYGGTGLLLGIDLPLSDSDNF